MANVEKNPQLSEGMESGSFSPMDTHGEDYLQTQEGANLPVPHCIKGTAGWEICDQIRQTVDLSAAKIYEKVTFGSREYALDWEKRRLCGRH